MTTIHRFWLLVSIMLFLLLLGTACTGPGTSPTASHRPVPTRPASVSASPKPTPTAKTYTGPNFRLTYPGNWQVQGSGDQVIFQDAQGLNALTVIVMPNSGGQKSAESLAETIFPLVEKAILTNPQAAQVAPAVTVARESWVQRGQRGR